MQRVHRAFIIVSLVLMGAANSLLGATNEPPKGWESSAALGLTVTSGNSDTLMFTAGATARKKWDVNELDLGADAAYGENEDVKNAESLRGYGQYNRLFSERVFGYARLEALHDAIADVEYRISFSPGLGYYFIKNETTFLRGEAGPGVIHEKLGDETDTYIIARLAERFEHKFSDTVKMWQSAEFLPQVDDFENFIFNGEIGVEAALSKKLSLRTWLQDTYDNQPAPGRQKNDLKLVSAVAYKF